MNFSPVVVLRRVSQGGGWWRWMEGWKDGGGGWKVDAKVGGW